MILFFILISQKQRIKLFVHNYDRYESFTKSIKYYLILLITNTRCNVETNFNLVLM